MRKYFQQNWPLLIVVALLWIASTLFYFTSGVASPGHVEDQVDTIIRGLDQAYANKMQPEDRRHFVMATFLREQYSTLWQGIELHLAIAFFVAGLLIIGVDSIVRTMTRREFQRQTDEVSQAIWRAMLRRFVPEELAQALESILKSDVCRIKSRYAITFRREPYQNIPAHNVVVRRELHYHLRNLTAQAIPVYPIKIQLIPAGGTLDTTDWEGNPIHIPAIRSLSIDGQSVAISNPKLLEHSISLKQMSDDNDGVEILSCAEELFETRDRALYMLTLPTIGLEVSIVNEVPDLIEPQQVFLSGGWVDKLHNAMPGTWACNDAILAGTVLVVSWKATEGHQQKRTADPAPDPQPSPNVI